MSLTHQYITAMYWHGTRMSINSGRGVKLVLLALNSLLSEMMWSCKCFWHDDTYINYVIRLNECEVIWSIKSVHGIMRFKIKYIFYNKCKLKKKHNKISPQKTILNYQFNDLPIDPTEIRTQVLLHTRRSRYALLHIYGSIVRYILEGFYYIFPWYRYILTIDLMWCQFVLWKIRRNEVNEVSKANKI